MKEVVLTRDDMEVIANALDLVASYKESLDAERYAETLVKVRKVLDISLRSIGKVTDETV